MTSRPQWSNEPQGSRDQPALRPGSRVRFAGTRRRRNTEGQVVARLSNGWVVVDFPAFCWVGDPRELEVVDDRVDLSQGR